MLNEDEGTTFEAILLTTCLSVITIVAERQVMSEWAEFLASTQEVLDSICLVMVDDYGYLKNHNGSLEEAI